MRICQKRNALILLGLTLSILTYGLASRSTCNAVPIANFRITAPAEATGSFTVNVTAENVLNFYGWEFILYWMPGYINCTAESINTAVWTSYLGPWIGTPIDNAAGQYHQSLTGKAPATGLDGTFHLVSLTFTTIKEPCNTTYINATTAPGMGFCLLDMDGNEIAHTYSNASVHIVPEYMNFYILPVMMGLSGSSLVAAKAIRRRK